MGTTFIQSGRFAAASFSPLDIAGCAGWWDASDDDSFTYSAGDDVSQWDDLSGNNRHLAQATGDRQPDRNGTQNGLDTVVFTKAADHYLQTGSFSLAQPYTLFVAGEFASGQVSPLSSIGGDELQIYTPSNTHAIYMGSQISYVQEAADYDPAVFGYVVNGASSAMYRNGTSKSTGDLGSTGITLGVRTAERNLNTGYYFADALFEIIFYDTALGTTDRQTVEDYLSSKWGTP